MKAPRVEADPSRDQHPPSGSARSLGDVALHVPNAPKPGNFVLEVQASEPAKVFWELKRPGGQWLLMVGPFESVESAAANAEEARHRSYPSAEIRVATPR
jgi:hypothetical protein